MTLKFEKEIEDVRGKVMFFLYHNKRINLVETKKGFARGGHYHSFESSHILLSGKVEYREENVSTGDEKIRIVKAPTTITVPKNVSHMLVALEDALFLEIFNQEYDAIDYPKYRKVVLDKMNAELKTKS